MPLKNTVHDYGTIAKWLHWAIAILFLCSYATVNYRHSFTEKDTPENWIALQLHLSVGVTIAALVVLRLLWRFTNQQPEPEPGRPIEHLAAKLGHFALYVVMIVAPITGYVGTGVATDFFMVFEIPKFADTFMYSAFFGGDSGWDYEVAEEWLDLIHKEVLGEFLIWLLVLGHALAACYHHFIKKDRTLKRMTTSNP